MLKLSLNTPVTYDETKSFARAMAQVGERAHPKLVVSNMAKDLRKGKVLIDWSQNAAAKTGLDPSLLKKMLPLLGMLAAGYMAK